MKSKQKIPKSLEKTWITVKSRCAVHNDEKWLESTVEWTHLAANEPRSYKNGRESLLARNMYWTTPENIFKKNKNKNLGFCKDIFSQNFLEDSWCTWVTLFFFYVYRSSEYIWDIFIHTHTHKTKLNPRIWKKLELYLGGFSDS